jgi:general secretion pathway protein G
MWNGKQRKRSGERGLSYLEMVVASMVVLVLASAIIPLARWDDKRRREVRLRGTLRQVRDAIDLYHKYVEEQMIVQSDVEQMGYPLTLEELYEGVEVSEPDSPDLKLVKFLQRMPIDPITEET